MTDKPDDDAEHLLQACGLKWPGPPFSCLGADHMDTVLQLPSPAVRNRTNPVRVDSTHPGGVAANIARYLALLGCEVRLYAPRPSSGGLDESGIKRIPLDGKSCDCGYTAVLDPDGELEMGLAAMDDYDDFDESSLPEGFPGNEKGTLVIDAAFKPAMVKAAAAQASSGGWKIMGAGTSPAKVGKLRDVAWDVLALNEAEAAVLTGQEAGHPVDMAEKIAHQTGGMVAVTCGADGACMVAKNSAYHLFAPPTALSNANGAGDVFAATLFACLAANAGPLFALRLAVGAGSMHAAGRKIDQGTIGDALREKYVASGSWPLKKQSV